MRRLSLVWVLVVAWAGCQATVETPDLALVPPGCRLPSKCYTVMCACNRADVEAPSGACLQCDPSAQGTNVQQCDCPASAGLSCVEPRQLCVGAGAVCTGVGARCLDPRHLDGGSEPPTMVAVDAGDGGVPSSEPRCAFADDVCIPGTDDGGADLSVPDLGNPPDLLGTD